MNLLKLQPILASVAVLSAIGLAHPVAAANWGDCSVESGTTIIIDTATTATINSSTTVTDITQAFVIASATGDVNVHQTKDHLVTAELLTTGDVEFERGGNVGELNIAYSIVQCQGSDKLNVQRGDINLSAGVASNTAALIAAVDTSYSLVTVTVSSDESSTTDSSSLVTAALQDVSTVVVQRAAASTSAITAHYQVIEFPGSSGVSVQTSETTLSAGSASTKVTLTTAVATDRTWVYCSYDATDNGLQQTAIGCALTDASTVTIYRYAASAYTNRVRVYAVTWPGDTVTVFSGTDSVDPTVADGDQFTHPITLSDPGADTSRSFPYLTNTTSGTTAPHPYPRNRWGAYLQDSNTLELVFWRPDSTGSTDATNFYWQVINFSPPYQATGWGWVGSSTDAIDGTALISFSCDNLTTYTGQDCGDGTAGTRYDYGVTLERGGCGDTCDVSGQAWIGNYGSGEASPHTTIGMIDFDPDVTTGPPLDQRDSSVTPEDDTLDAHWNEETGEVYGWARFRALEDYEDSLGGTDNDWGWIKLRGAETTAGAEYGVQFAADTLEFSGWSWNDNGTQLDTTTAEDGSGFGWIKFDLDTSVSTVGDAWLRTTQADVYSQQGFDMTTAAPTGEYNATYLIVTSGGATTISAFSTQDPLLENEGINTDLGSVPTDSTATTQVFRGDLGTIYVNELIDQAEHVDTDGTCNDSLISSDTNPLGGDIFYCDGDMTVSNNLTFYNGTGSNIGSGTIVVDGDLYLNDNLNYFNSTIDQHINNLASVAWIVTGRIILDPSVTELVGAFIVLGDAHVTSTDPYDFDTGSSTLPLTLHGLVMARSFNFQRTSIGTTTDPEPGEDIRYDGRVFANPPPGLEDLASLLPEFD